MISTIVVNKSLVKSVRQREQKVKPGGQQIAWSRACARQLRREPGRQAGGGAV